MTNEPETQTDYLPQVRCTPRLKRRLEQVAQGSITPSLADHIRYALEQYIASEEGKLAAVTQPPLLSPPVGQ